MKYFFWPLLASLSVLSACGGDTDHTNQVQFEMNGEAFTPNRIDSLNDLKTTPKRFGDQWAYLIHAAQDDGYCLTLNIPEGMTTGTARVIPVIDPTTDSPLVIMHPCDAYEAHDLFLPEFGSTIELDTLPDTTDRLIITFDALTLRDGCGKRLVLTDGTIDVRLKSAGEFPATAFNWGPSEVTYPDLHGSVALDGSEHAFTALRSRLKKDLENMNNYQGDVVNICKSDSILGQHQGFTFSLPRGVTSGSYELAELAPNFWLVDLESDDPDAIDGTFYRAIYEGQVELLMPQSLPGFMVIDITEPLVFRPIVQDGSDVRWSDRVRIAFETGRFRVWVPADGPH